VHVFQARKCCEKPRSILGGVAPVKPCSDGAVFVAAVGRTQSSAAQGLQAKRAVPPPFGALGKSTKSVHKSVDKNWKSGVGR
jgi:hypothetical protein